jgi:hypothetical protein
LDLAEPGPPANIALVRRKFINSDCCDSSTPRSARSWQVTDLGARLGDGLLACPRVVAQRAPGEQRPCLDGLLHQQ